MPPDGREIPDKNFEFEPGNHYDGVRIILSDRIDNQGSGGSREQARAGITVGRRRPT